MTQTDTSYSGKYAPMEESHEGLAYCRLTCRLTSSVASTVYQRLAHGHRSSAAPQALFLLRCHPHNPIMEYWDPSTPKWSALCYGSSASTLMAIAKYTSQSTKPSSGVPSGAWLLPESRLLKELWPLAPQAGCARTGVSACIAIQSVP